MPKVTIGNIGSVLAALTLIMAAVAGGFAGAGVATDTTATWDTETTTSASTSDVSGGTVLSFYPENDTKQIRVQTDQVSASKGDLKVVVSHPSPDINTTYYSYGTESGESWTTVNSTNGQFMTQINHTALSDVPRVLNGGEVEVSVVNASNDHTLTTATVALDTSHKSATTARIPVLDVSGSSAAYDSPYVADDLDVSKESGMIPLLGSSETVASFSDEISVDGTNTTVEVPIRDSETQSAFDAAASDVSSGEWMTDATLVVNNEPLKIYKDNASNVESGQAYAVYDSTNKVLTLKWNGDKDFQNADGVVIDSTAGDSYEFGTLSDAFGVQSAFDVLTQELPVPA